jgi:hypothetical protein
MDMDHLLPKGGLKERAARNITYLITFNMNLPIDYTHSGNRENSGVENAGGLTG